MRGKLLRELDGVGDGERHVAVEHERERWADGLPAQTRCAVLGTEKAAKTHVKPVMSSENASKGGG